MAFNLSSSNFYGLQILDAHDTYEDFILEHPTGQSGDVHLVGTNIYSWSPELNSWIDGGRIVGPDGPQGAAGTNGTNGTSPNLQSVAENIVPDTTDIRTLGTSTKRWADVYIGPNTLNIIDQTLLTNAAITVNNGVFNIQGIVQAQLPDVKVTNLTFNDNTVQTTAPGVPVSYNPTWSGTGLAFTGTPATGSYMKVGKLVTFRFKVVCTTVTNFGTGQYSITLPFNVATNYSFRDGTIHRNSNGNHYPLKAHIDSGNVMTLWDGSGATDTVFDHNSPYSLTTSDYFYITGTYESV